MDSVEIRGLSCRCIIGIFARERLVPQPVRLDIELSLDLERAGKSGRIAHTVDYSRASGEIIALLKFRRYTLLEVAAEECTGWLFAAYPAVQAVNLRILKPQALAGQAESGGVRITRKRPESGARQSTDYGYIEPQLEASEANIALVSLDPGKRLTPAALAAESVLLLPLTGHLVGEKAFLPHQPARLSGDDHCQNHDSGPALLVVCAQRVPHS